MTAYKNKAFLGALIGAGTSLIGGFFANKAKKKAATEQARQQQIDENKKSAFEQAINLTNVYGNQDYVDDYDNRIEFAKGGFVKNPASKFIGRNKFETGGVVGTENNNTVDTNKLNLINELGNSLPTLTGGILSLINKPITTSTTTQQQVGSMNANLASTKPNSYDSKLDNLADFNKEHKKLMLQRLAKGGMFRLTQ